MQSLVLRKKYWECTKIGQGELRKIVCDENPNMFAAISFQVLDSLSSLRQYKEVQQLAQLCVGLYEAGVGGFLDGQAISLYFHLCKALSHNGKAAEARDAFQRGLQIVPISQLTEMDTMLIVREGFSCVTMAYEDAGALMESYHYDATLYRFACKVSANMIQFADFGRRTALILIRIGDVPGAALILRNILAFYKDGYNGAINWSFPDSAADGWHRTLEVAANFFEEHFGPQERDLVERIKGEVSERKAIEEALKVALRTSIRDEAVQAITSGNRGEDEQKLGRARRRKKSGKARRRSKKACEPATTPVLAVVAGYEDSKDGVGELPEEDWNCCVTCLLPLEEAASVILQCGHEHHMKCLQLWKDNCLAKNWIPTCPSCRLDLSQNNI